MHSSDKARRSLCMFSRSFFTASGLLVPDMVPPGPSRSGNGTAGWHCQFLGRWAASRRPLSLPQPSPGLRGRTHGRAWARPRGVPESPSSAAPHRRRLLAELCPQPYRPSRLRRRRLGSPPGGQVPPAAAGPGHGGRHQAELARSFSDACPRCPDSPTPLAE